MGFLFFDLIPDDSIYNVSAKLIHSKHFLWAEHRLMISLLANMLFACFLELLSLVCIHFYLKHHQVVVVIENLFVFVL